MADETPRLLPYLERERDRMLADLVAWLRIPGISALDDHRHHVDAGATWFAEQAEAAGFEHVEVLPTGGGAGLPAVTADWLHAGPDAPTVVVYGHHDVQPVDPLDLWVSPPFDPQVRDGQLFARGAVDDKGQVWYHLEAFRALMERDGTVPVNLKLVVEGEEEIGSRHFEEFLVEQRERLACDVVVVSDTGMVAPDVPSFCTGMRGLVVFDVHLRTADGDLHSGSFGGAAPNAARLAAELAAALHDERGRVTLPGFYDRVRPLTVAERASFAALPLDDATWAAAAGVRYVEGEEGFTAIERTWARPTAEVVGIHAGYGGEGIKTVIPATAVLKVTFRLVADQVPADVRSAFRSWLAERVPVGVEVDVRSEGPGVAAALTDVAHPAVGALSRAIARVWGREPLYTREGGSGPEEALARVLDAPLLFLGVGLPDDRIHAPNERIVLDQFWRGLLATGELWYELAQAEGVRRQG
jgi:acetylornithine deacetylase/succinyl-diaminopimelate desuccinylase-like protein